jgi:hypothetical protein
LNQENASGSKLLPMIDSAALLDQFVSEDLLVFAAGPDWE